MTGIEGFILTTFSGSEKKGLWLEQVFTQKLFKFNSLKL